MKKFNLALSVLIILIAGTGAYFLATQEVVAPSEPVACTADAMICPDGSAVGRQGPKCEFAPCPASTSTTSIIIPPGIRTYDSGIAGVVTMGPVCPVMQYPPEEECADRAYLGEVRVFRASNQTQVFASTNSDAEGRFYFSLPPGNYVVKAGKNPFPSCSETPVTVRTDAVSNIAISCDTGIRGASPAPVACTMEAKICPDGSAVGRTGPNCEFSPCPGN